MNLSSRKSFFQILDLGLALDSDSERFREVFERDYHRFRTTDLEYPRKLTVSVRLRDSVPSVSIDGQVISLKGHPEPEIQTYRLVLEALFERFDNFLLLHAGAVVKNGRALIVAGPPRSGKSTLVLELVKKGYSFYSDDICPLNRESRRVYPFPRSPWARPGRFRAVPDVRALRLRGDKLPVDLDESEARVDAAPSPAACLICLDPDEPPPTLCALTLALKENGAENVLDDLRANGNFTIESLESAQHDWRVQYPTGVGLTGEVRRLLEKHRDRIWNVYRDDAVSPDFSRDPVLEPISVDAAAFRLLRDLKKGFPTKDRSESSTESPGRLFFALNRMIRDTACYRLRVGRLDDMVGLIVQALEAAG